MANYQIRSCSTTATIPPGQSGRVIFTNYDRNYSDLIDRIRIPRISVTLFNSINQENYGISITQGDATHSSAFISVNGIITLLPAESSIQK